MKERHILDYLDQTQQSPKLKKIFTLAFEHTLEVLGKQGDYEVSLSLVSTKEIHKLNKQYRNIDAPTDVLTFAYSEADVLPEEPINDLGSILISPEIAKKGAKKYSHPLEREMAFLFIHGLLHAFGYEHHRSEEEAEEMFALQNKILNTMPYDFFTELSAVKKELYLAQKRSYSPYSHFAVGAIVTTKDGKRHPGFNIENAAFGASMCAERCALYHTYASGYGKEDIASLSLITSSHEEIGSPCGTCRQVMSELMNLYCPVYIFNDDEKKMVKTTVEGLLPYVFTSERLTK